MLRSLIVAAALPVLLAATPAKVVAPGEDGPTCAECGAAPSGPTTTTTTGPTTSTAVGATTSSTTTSTAGTTTTVPTAALLVLPDYASGSPFTANVTANAIYCARYTPRFSIAGATSLRAAVDGGTATCGIAVYPDTNGATALAVGSVACPAAAGVVSITGLAAFSLTGGTPYRVCVCTSAAMKWLCAPDTNLAGLVPIFAPSNLGVLGGACTAGVPPATAPTLTVAGGNPPLVVVE